MTRDIIGKLRDHLAEPVETECAVVYLLAEVRKILEREKPDPKPFALWMHCHWALHVNLTRTPTTIAFLHRVDDFVTATVKCPDFIFEDTDGLLHLVECKGTQTGRSQLQSQLNNGIEQKRSILFVDEANHVSQRIVGGLYIASFDAPDQSSISISDPPPEGGIIATINAEATLFLHDIVARGSLARQFELVGSPEMAMTIRAHREDRERVSYNVADRLGTLEARIQTLPGADGQWIGRVVNMPFPRRVETDQGSFGGVRLIHAVDRRFLGNMWRFDGTAETLDRALPATDFLSLGWSWEESQYGASVYQDGAFLSAISLVERL